MKKCLFLVLSLVMLMAVPMTVAADTEDPSPSKTYDKKDPKKSTSTSPKTADNGMAELAMALFVISGGVLFMTKKELEA